MSDRQRSLLEDVWVSAIRAWMLGAQGRRVQGSLVELVSQRSQDSTEELGGIPRLCCRVDTLG